MASLDIQAICNIAMRHVGHVVADATIAACVQAAYRDGILLVLTWPDEPTREAFRERARHTGEVDATAEEWRRYVERNSDTRLNHV